VTLAADPRVPRRDALLRPATMAGVISQRLHQGRPVERAERTYVKYRVGESLRVVYRYALAGQVRYVAVRTARSGGAPAPEVGARLYRFPYDRKLEHLHALAPDSPILERVLGQPVTPRLVAYAAEQSAAAACRDARGNVIAYAKVQATDAEYRGCRALAAQDDVRVPRIFAHAHGVLVLEALVGRRLDHDANQQSLHEFGATLAKLHDVKGSDPSTLPRFDRLDSSRLATAARVIATARPDCADAAHGLLERLQERPETPDVTLHGDANLRNALQLAGGRVALLDLEHLSTGPAEADLGQVLAALLASRTRGTKAFLAGYDRPIDGEALRWHTAASLLARIALPAISRYRPVQLNHLCELLEAGTSVITPVAA
jgi:aminoglycoside phosphotransferase (APT) family kinase protein